MNISLCFYPYLTEKFIIAPNLHCSFVMLGAEAKATLAGRAESTNFIKRTFVSIDVHIVDEGKQQQQQQRQRQQQQQQQRQQQ